MTNEKITNPDQIKSVPQFMEEVKKAYGVEVPINLPPNHPLTEIWATSINVTEGASPAPRYTATGNITDQFPFNFAQSTQLKPVMNLKIDVFKPIPEFPSMRGVKATVYRKEATKPGEPATVFVSYDKKEVVSYAEKPAPGNT